MSRSGYIDDLEGDEVWSWICWRGAVASAIRGRRGQAFLKEMRESMDSMHDKKLIAHKLEQSGSVCAIGSVGARRGVDMSELDPENYSAVANAFGINEKLAQEIVWVNDESGPYKETDEDRFKRVRAWVEANIKDAAGQS